jgi:hypothetical protein
MEVYVWLRCTDLKEEKQMTMNRKKFHDGRTKPGKLTGDFAIIWNKII